MDKPENWADRVNELVEPQTLERVRLSIARNRPYGDEQWIARVAKRPWAGVNVTRSLAAEEDPGKGAMNG